MTGEQIILGKTTLSIAGPGFDNSFPIFHHCSGEYMQSTNYTSTLYMLWIRPRPLEGVSHWKKVLMSPNNGLALVLQKLLFTEIRCSQVPTMASRSFVISTHGWKPAKVFPRLWVQNIGNKRSMEMLEELFTEPSIFQRISVHFQPSLMGRPWPGLKLMCW